MVISAVAHKAQPSQSNSHRPMIDPFVSPEDPSVEKMFLEQLSVEQISGLVFHHPTHCAFDTHRRYNNNNDDQVMQTLFGDFYVREGALICHQTKFIAGFH